MRERYVLLGLAQPRVEWYRTVGQWAAAAMLPLEFVRCVSVGELRARLRSGRAFSAVLIDGRFPGLDRDLIAEAAEAGVAVLVVDAHDTRAWHELGAAAVLAEAFSRDELVEVLQATAIPIGGVDLDPLAPPSEHPAARAGLIAVGGPGGTGASTLAIALAQGLASGHGHLPPGRRSRVGRPGRARRDPAVLLADLCRVADQALLHDSRVLVPSVQEVVEAHRTSRPPLEAVADQTFEVPARGYRLLLGLRRPRHWVTLRPRALESALDALQSLADVVIADVELDVEGEAESGSTDVEDRNLLARATLARADPRSSSASCSAPRTSRSTSIGTARPRGCGAPGGRGRPLEPGPQARPAGLRPARPEAVVERPSATSPATGPWSRCSTTTTSGRS
jgi:hypothetical protein